MSIIKDAEKLCTIINSVDEFQESVKEGKTLAFIVKDNVDCCTSFIKNLVTDPDLKEILTLFEINSVYLDFDNFASFGNFFQKEDVYCVPFVIAYEDGKRINHLSSNIPASRFQEYLDQWYDF